MPKTQQNIVTNIIDAIAANQLPLPTQPEIAIMIEEATQDPHIEAEDLEDIICKDPALTARIIRLANSPLVRGKFSVDDLDTAICRLGLNFVANMAIGLAMEQLFKAKNNLIAEKMHAVWINSAQVAGVSHLLAKRFTNIPPEQATIAGLLHEIGTLPILSYFHNDPELIKNSQLLEQIIMDCAPNLGCEILKSWQFQDELANVPSKVYDFYTDKQQADLADIVLIAKLYVIQNTNHHLNRLDKKEFGAYSRLGLDPTKPLDHNDTMAQALDEAKKLFA